VFSAISKNRFLGTARQSSRDAKVEAAVSTTSIEAFQLSLKIFHIVSSYYSYKTHLKLKIRLHIYCNFVNLKMYRYNLLREIDRVYDVCT